MRNICDKAPAGVLQRIELIRHHIKALPQLADLVAACDLDARIKFPFGKAPDDIVHIGDGLCHAPRNV